ncbi:hypothetical protein F5X97DRAFT_345024 [Nemania serpens]|nr:hypothetical protein F5X97DRAFT_345024 [Nemania serpens]
MDGFGMAQQIIPGEAQLSPIAPNLMQGFVAVSINAAMIWPAVNLPPSRDSMRLRRHQQN